MKSNTFLELAPEIHLHIFSGLDPQTLLSLSQVSWSKNGDPCTGGTLKQHRYVDRFTKSCRPSRFGRKRYISCATTKESSSHRTQSRRWNWPICNERHLDQLFGIAKYFGTPLRRVASSLAERDLFDTTHTLKALNPEGITQSFWSQEVVI